MYKCTNNNDCNNGFLCCVSCDVFNKCKEKRIECQQLQDCKNVKECPYVQELE